MLSAASAPSVENWIDMRIIEPRNNLIRIEPQEVAPLQVWNATLGDQPTHMSDSYPKAIGDLVDVDEPGKRHRTSVTRKRGSPARRTPPRGM